MCELNNEKLKPYDGKLLWIEQREDGHFYQVSDEGAESEEELKE